MRSIDPIVNFPLVWHFSAKTTAQLSLWLNWYSFLPYPYDEAGILLILHELGRLSVM